MKNLEAVIFDWAGTTVEHGSMTTVKAITALLARTRPMLDLMIDNRLAAVARR